MEYLTKSLQERLQGWMEDLEEVQQNALRETTRDLVLLREALDEALKEAHEEGFDEGFERAKQTVQDWYEPEPPERED